MILGHSEKVGRCRISYDEEGLLREERESPFFVSYAGEQAYADPHSVKPPETCSRVKHPG